MKRNVLLLILTLGCASTPDDVEMRASAVSNFSPTWHAVPSPPLQPTDSPAFARAAGSTRWVAATQVGDATVYTTREDPAGSGTFSSTWHSTTPPAGVITAPELIPLPSGHYLVVVVGATDHQVWGLEQDETGAFVYQAWHTIQAGATFRSGVAGAINAAPTVGSSGPTLMLVGRGMDDHLYTSKNVIGGGSYQPSGWGGFVFIDASVYTGRPAVVDVCGGVQGASFVIAGLYLADQTYRYYAYNGTTWSAANQIYYGNFVSGPALVCATSAAGTEISIWGIGFYPNQLWYSTQLNANGTQGFTAASSSGLSPNVTPTAHSYQGALKVGMWINGVPAYADAKSP